MTLNFDKIMTIIITTSATINIAFFFSKEKIK